MRLTLASPAGLFGAVHVCVVLASPDGGRLCHSAAGSGGQPGVFPFSFRLRLRPNAPLGRSPRLGAGARRRLERERLGRAAGRRRRRYEEAASGRMSRRGRSVAAR